jgi:O-antigen/teichoic acid export membrane protein
MAIDREVIYLEIEKSRIKREKSMLVLNKSLMLYFCFLLVGVIGFVYSYVSALLLNLLIIGGLCILILGTIPYVVVVTREEKKIDELLNNLKKRK